MSVRSPLTLVLQMVNEEENQELIEFILENVDPKNHVVLDLDWIDRFSSSVMSWTISRSLKPTQRFSPMHIAAYFGYIDVVKHLIPKLDNPNAANDTGITPIYLAALKGHLGIYG